MGIFTSPADVPVMMFFVQIVIILFFARALGMVLAHFKQPQVIGEIIAGIILGPTVLGRIPGFTYAIFPANSMSLLTTLGQIGLVFFMFFLALELDPQLMFNNWKMGLPVAVASIVLPFSVAFGWSYYLFTLDTITTEKINFSLFIASAFSFKAFPVLARILTSTNLIASPLGIAALATAAIDDVLTWCMLAVVLAISSGGDSLTGFYILLLVLGYFLFMIYGVVPLVRQWQKHLIEKGDEMNQFFVTFVLFIMCMTAFYMEGIGVHAFFGGFAAGIVMPREGKFVERLAEKIELLIVDFFVPLYFCLSGIQTQLDTLDSGTLWGATFATIVLACCTTIPAVVFSSRLFIANWRVCFTLGVLMNTRGLIALIALNIGLQKGILTPKIFALMVVMAIVTTLMTAPIVDLVYSEPRLRKLKRKEEEERLKEIELQSKLRIGEHESAGAERDFQNTLNSRHEALVIDVDAHHESIPHLKRDLSFPVTNAGNLNVLNVINNLTTPRACTTDEFVNESDAAVIEQKLKEEHLDLKRPLHVPNGAEISALMDARAKHFTDAEIEKIVHAPDSHSSAQINRQNSRIDSGRANNDTSMLHLPRGISRLPVDPEHDFQRD